MFKSARIKLTVWYLVIMMGVLLFFSTILFHIMTRELSRFEEINRLRIEQKLDDNAFPIAPPPLGLRSFRRIVEDPELIQDTKRRIILFLTVLNGGILGIAGVLGYFLAGRTLRPIQHMNDEQNRFISDASHELKTPLTSLKTSFEVFLRSKQPNMIEAKEIVTDGIIDINHLQTLAESLLQLAYTEDKNKNTSHTPFEIDSIVDKVINSLKTSAKQKKIRIVYEKSNIHFTGNSDEFVQLGIVLLDNAIKYSPHNSTILIKTSKTDGHIVFTTEDEGIGISTKDMPRIFDRFYRAEKARAQGAGYGLGLAIAQKLVKGYGGKILATSRKPHGTRFEVIIPMKQ